MHMAIRYIYKDKVCIYKEKVCIYKGQTYIARVISYNDAHAHQLAQHTSRDDQTICTHPRHHGIHRCPLIKSCMYI